MIGLERTHKGSLPWGERGRATATLASDNEASGLELIVLRDKHNWPWVDTQRQLAVGRKGKGYCHVSERYLLAIMNPYAIMLIVYLLRCCHSRSCSTN